VLNSPILKQKKLADVIEVDACLGALVHPVALKTSGLESVGVEIDRRGIFSKRHGSAISEWYRLYGRLGILTARDDHGSRGF